MPAPHCRIGSCRYVRAIVPHTTNFVFKQKTVWGTEIMDWLYKNKVCAIDHLFYLFLNVWNTWNGKKYPIAEVIFFSICCGFLIPIWIPSGNESFSFDIRLEKNIACESWNAKTFSISNGKWISHLQMDIFCHLKFCHNKGKSFTLHSTIQN